MAAPIFNPPVPFWTSIPGGGLFPGNSVRIAGQVPWGAHRFSINLCQYQGGDYTLHINPRFDQDVVVFNSQFGGSWGAEERAELPLRQGENFELLLECTSTAYRVAVNGRHLKEYHHRNAPGASTSMLHIDGDVQIRSVHINPPGPVICPPAPGYPSNPGGFVPPGMPYVPPTAPYVPPTAPYVPPSGGGPAQASRQPVYSPSLPFTYPLYGGVKPGNVVRIAATPSPYASRIVINLQCGAATHSTPDLGLHISCRFNENVIVLNTREHHSYGSEVRGPYFPMRPGAPFQLEIMAEPHGYLVTVDGVPVGTMPHRVHPMTRVDSLVLEGDMKVSSITF